MKSAHATVSVSFCRDNPEPGEIAGALFVARLVALLTGERREAVRS